MEKWSIAKAATLTDLTMCFNHYRVLTPGLYACTNVGVKLNNDIICPDFMMMIGSGVHQQCKPDFENDYFVGPPNLVLDMLQDDNAEIISKRKSLFESSGVLEYLIIEENLKTFEWNRLIDGKYQEIHPGESGLIKSSSFPGLWVPIEKVKKRDNWAFTAAITEGVTRKEHHEMMQTIWKKRKSKSLWNKIWNSSQ